MALYLITGVAGFIGSNLARELLRRGEQVRGIDNLSTGRRENLSDLRGLDFHEADLLDIGAVSKSCAGVDYILHQAAIPSVPKSVQSPEPSHAANINGTFNLLIAAFNIIPAFPMDGGRVLRALLASRFGYVRATEIAASIGQFVAFALGFIGLMYNPILIFIAIFVYLAASSEAHMVALRAAS